MAIGVVAAFDRHKGSGFISPVLGGPDVYVHVSAIEHAHLPDLAVGTRVRFDIRTDKLRNRSVAVNLELV